MPQQLPPLDDLVACPQCDTLHNATLLPEGARAQCMLCGHVLMTSRPAALVQILSLALAALVLMIAAIGLPFLEISAAGQQNSVSVVEAVLAFNYGISRLLALAVAGFIIVIPLLRLASIVFTVAPLVVKKPPNKYAHAAFALAESLRPWSMAEIFVVGVAISLVKVAGLATFYVGPAFWAFGGLVVISIIKDQLICRYSIWEILDQSQP